jgi:hypothetical protein
VFCRAIPVKRPEQRGKLFFCGWKKHGDEILKLLANLPPGGGEIHKEGAHPEHGGGRPLLPFVDFGPPKLGKIDRNSRKIRDLLIILLLKCGFSGCFPEGCDWWVFRSVRRAPAPLGGE